MPMGCISAAAECPLTSFTRPIFPSVSHKYLLKLQLLYYFGAADKWHARECADS